MNLEHSLRHPTRSNSASNPLWMDGLRILLGLFLFVKGLLFIEHTSDVFYYFASGQTLLSAHKASLLASTVHMVGGTMIVFGFLTRLSLLFQLPILITALIIVNLRRGMFVENTELWLSLVVTGLLLFFMIVGPGRYSVDNKILRHRPLESLN
ncbi:DoxX family protein [Rhodocytophaga rosea]|uniref:DoxX family protein n=1 Tax=Rhodocytophaga rosea TaxID=2704465 RepID=A0A6C0GW34_9BACT|nr:DoxX family protein [Rhodocytophaga rosea]QHT71500.1 DoxX family protein [Rhodocytophaga rosea]